MSRIFSGFVQCRPGSGNTLMDVQGYGPVSVAIQQWDNIDMVLGFTTRCSTSGQFTTPMTSTIAGVTQETTHAATDSGHNGDGTTLAFAYTIAGNGDMGKGASWNLGGQPVLPGTVVVTDAGAVAPNLQDLFGTGVLYTIDSDNDVAGAVDYDFGYVTLAYPTGKAPGTGVTAINVACREGTWLTAYGNRLLELATPIRDNIVRIRGMSPGTADASCRIKLDVVFGW